jgi:hypothetical protein
MARKCTRRVGICPTSVIWQPRRCSVNLPIGSAARVGWRANITEDYLNLTAA